MSEVEFQQITLENPDFAKAIALYQQSFLPQEIIPIPIISRSLKLGNIQLWGGYYQQEFALMSIVHPLPNSEFVLLGYLATVPHLRNIKIGSRFLEYIINVVQQDDKSLILEVEHPDFGENRQLKQRRVAFYRRLGAKIFQDIIYIFPALDGTTTTEMMLMIIGEKHHYKLPQTLVQQLIRDLYSEVYNCNPDDSIFNWIADIKHDINLVS
ncbi:MAG: N-acetyltransferase [Limnospira sp. PMC 1291.21]|uniref:N-acetyltransferase n=1 Tax=unclassified Limnospira TaxID=2642885 RepID=UPI0028E0AC0C|nr:MULTISPECIES: N-acetyltransferase [unclassified Limnospira]MDT9177022.1 N-acetyltransferase [Limnospira sp. PMC 1238.20]MDT9192200.1 N-acetyltransferase [Limnospira sp. PMC 1245.20]MDT9202548.1 N-acetyltransferase [Limnospira sp. PMC 1243.20]MDT9207727.1 N-acetyltransferase [Limnospira sp. PMC 1252.20]MDT9212319.1 N-acetyltransferase [Limnospira sp. PMC 1256.20]